MVSPLSMALSTMWLARAAYSVALPSRAGCGTWVPRLFCAASLALPSWGFEDAWGDGDDAYEVAGEFTRATAGPSAVQL